MFIYKKRKFRVKVNEHTHPYMRRPLHHVFESIRAGTYKLSVHLIEDPISVAIWMVYKILALFCILQIICALLMYTEKCENEKFKQ